MLKIFKKKENKNELMKVNVKLRNVMFKSLLSTNDGSFLFAMSTLASSFLSVISLTYFEINEFSVGMVTMLLHVAFGVSLTQLGYNFYSFRKDKKNVSLFNVEELGDISENIYKFSELFGQYSEGSSPFIPTDLFRKFKATLPKNKIADLYLEIINDKRFSSVSLEFDNLSKGNNEEIVSELRSVRDHKQMEIIFNILSKDYYKKEITFTSEYGKSIGFDELKKTLEDRKIYNSEVTKLLNRGKEDYSQNLISQLESV